MPSQEEEETRTSGLQLDTVEAIYMDVITMRRAPAPESAANAMINEIEKICGIACTARTGSTGDDSEVMENSMAMVLQWTEEVHLDAVRRMLLAEPIQLTTDTTVVDRRVVADGWGAVWRMKITDVSGACTMFDVLIYAPGHGYNMMIDKGEEDPLEEMTVFVRRPCQSARY